MCGAPSSRLCCRCGDLTGAAAAGCLAAAGTRSTLSRACWASHRLLATGSVLPACSKTGASCFVSAAVRKQQAGAVPSLWSVKLLLWRYLATNCCEPALSGTHLVTASTSTLAVSDAWPSPACAGVNNRIGCCSCDAVLSCAVLCCTVAGRLSPQALADLCIARQLYSSTLMRIKQQRQLLVLQLAQLISKTHSRTTEGSYKTDSLFQSVEGRFLPSRSDECGLPHIFQLQVCSRTFARDCTLVV